MATCIACCCDVGRECEQEREQERMPLCADDPPPRYSRQPLRQLLDNNTDSVGRVNVLLSMSKTGHCRSAEFQRTLVPYFGSAEDAYDRAFKSLAQREDAPATAVDINRAFGIPL